MQSRKEWRARRQRRRIVGSVECEKRREFRGLRSVPLHAIPLLPNDTQTDWKGRLIREEVRSDV